MRRQTHPLLFLRTIISHPFISSTSSSRATAATTTASTTTSTTTNTTTNITTTTTTAVAVGLNLHHYHHRRTDPHQRPYHRRRYSLFVTLWGYYWYYCWCWLSFSSSIATTAAFGLVQPLPIRLGTWNHCNPCTVVGLSQLTKQQLQLQPTSKSVFLKMTTSSSSSGPDGTTTTTTSSTTIISRREPPRPPREEDRVVWAGIAPPGWGDTTNIPRQAQESSEPLLDPPIPIADPYGWMRDDQRTNPIVLNHLADENAYTEAWTNHLMSSVRDQLYQEMVSSIQETDYTVPRPKGDYYYYTRTYQGMSYTQHVRAPKYPHPPHPPPSQLSSADGTTDSTLPLPLPSLPTVVWDGSNDTPILMGEQSLLDVNVLAQGQSYCSTGGIKTSPSQRLLAYTVDFTGGETYQLTVKDIETNAIIDHDPTLETSGNIVWGHEDSILFYMKMDSNHRPYQLYRRRIGDIGTQPNDSNQHPNDQHPNQQQSDELLWEEPDDMYYSHISKTLDGKFLLLEIASKETSEIWYLDLETPETTLQCIAPRRNKVLYEVEHRHGTWWIQTNEGGTPNMKLMTCPVGGTPEDWTLVNDPNDVPLFDGSYDRSLEGVTAFDSHIVLTGRQGGIPRVWILEPNTLHLEQLQFEEPAHDVGLAANLEFDTATIAISYDSMITPPQTLLISLADPSSERIILKAKNVPGYDKSLYACDRTTVLSRDGTTAIPISLVYRKDVMDQNLQQGLPVPTHLYGYGSYGASIEADFRATRLPLLNRGMVYVIAHVRGGGEMGRPWYEEPNGAKFLCKKNTFYDFVDVAQWLISERKLTTPDRLSCEGRSAGGMLIGTSINYAPELFKVAMLGVPFVDVVCTMVDASIPLTALEWVEWGNPNEVKYHQYMMEYSPMNTVKAGAKYPACWLTGGLHDPRVAYWEPAKFAATLRHLASPESGPICLKMDLSAGHFSASDRYKYLKELALDYAFLLDQLGLIQTQEQGQTTE